MAAFARFTSVTTHPAPVCVAGELLSRRPFLQSQNQKINFHVTVTFADAHMRARAIFLSVYPEILSRISVPRALSTVYSARVAFRKYTSSLFLSIYQQNRLNPPTRYERNDVIRGGFPVRTWSIIINDDLWIF